MVMALVVVVMGVVMVGWVGCDDGSGDGGVG